MEYKGKGPACGANLAGLFALLDPNTYSLRTLQCSLFEDSSVSYATCGKAGMMRNGKLYRRECLDTHTSARDAILLPTPCKSDHIGVMNTLNAYKRYYAADHQDKLVYQCHLNGLTPQQCNTIYELVMGFSEGWTKEE